ncbi:GDP-mannose 4,6-dehydratase [Rosettibacter firmus]|uniref:GDP-mannose 4,6-dehydratase n=1 Tax=Rosettibacter firmus TaxID=3111522 RepID=UPI00336C0F9D
MKILITGAAGFIGSNLIDSLIKDNQYQIIGIDNFDNFYEREIKVANLKNALGNINFSFYELDILDRINLTNLFLDSCPDIVIHLAAKAGVRNSIQNPISYFEVNVLGTLNVLEAMRISESKKMIFASSSSVYGNCKDVPFREDMNVDNPISPYAASKKAGELLCHTYHHLYKMDIFCLRFFTVYGPRQRPDLAIHKFTKSIFRHEEIPLYGYGQTRRDYTHINDIIKGIKKSIELLKGYEILNLGGSKPISLEYLVNLLESITGKKARKKFLPIQDGDLLQTYADISRAREILGYTPEIEFEEGIIDFVNWFKQNNHV